MNGPAPAVLASRIERDAGSGCWLWRGRVASSGYAYYGPRLAHVIAYEQAHGVVPAGMQLDHLCRVRHCINPNHLEPVTPAVNTRRSRAPKLSESKAADIRQLRKGGQSLRALARQFGVDKRTIIACVRHETWRTT